jgi:hypothetical protein
MRDTQTCIRAVFGVHNRVFGSAPNVVAVAGEIAGKHSVFSRYESVTRSKEVFSKPIERNVIISRVPEEEPLHDSRIDTDECGFVIILKRGKVGIESSIRP